MKITNSIGNYLAAKTIVGMIEKFQPGLITAFAIDLKSIDWKEVLENIQYVARRSLTDEDKAEYESFRALVEHDKLKE